MSHKVNGVSELHSNLMVHRYLPTLRKSSRVVSPTSPTGDAASLAGGSEPIAFSRVGRHLGRNWRTDLSLLNDLQQHWISQWLITRCIRRSWRTKSVCGVYRPAAECGGKSESAVRCQIKRIHEYKRQLMNVLHVITAITASRPTRMRSGYRA